MTKNMTATAVAHPNIAFIKYWGNQNEVLRIPVNNSISMNLAGLETRTTVTFTDSFKQDSLSINGDTVKESGLSRVSKMLDHVRKTAGITLFAQVESKNNFPTGSGIASSASAFAALAVASSSAAELTLSEKELSRLARTGSGSASRSVSAGFVEWYAGSDHQSSYAASSAPPEHWDLADCIAVVSDTHKATGSTGGHALAPTSPLQLARVADATRRMDICRSALLNKDFPTFANIVELDSNMMHAVMMSSEPNLFYWDPPTIEIMQAVQRWRAKGQAVCYTIDAGPNVHVLCKAELKEKVAQQLENIPGVKKVLTANPGGPAQIIN
ncbi:MAG: diphosphomevalonate decarboxylase [Chloroflexota bacterium]